MANEGVREPFRSILASILRPVEYGVNVASHRQEFRTRFHPDDLDRAFSMLLCYVGQPDTLEDMDRLEQGWKHAILSLEAEIQRREEQELEAQHRYELGRVAGGIAPMLHDSDTDPGGAK